jgi:hypothetical protein
MTGKDDRKRRLEQIEANAREQLGNVRNWARWERQMTVAWARAMFMHSLGGDR